MVSRELEPGKLPFASCDERWAYPTAQACSLR